MCFLRACLGIRMERAAQIRNSQMEVWKENRNCQHEKTKTAVNQKGCQGYILVQKKQQFLENGYEEL